MLYNHNGKICETVEIGVNNRSFLYGDGLFERLRVFNGKVFNHDNHKNRLSYSLEQLELNLEITIDQLFHSVEELVKENKIELSSSVRITIYRNEGGLYTPFTNSASYIIESSIVPQDSFVLSDGLKLGVYDKYKKSLSAISNIKSSSALLYVLASNNKRELNINELLLLNDFDRPIEGTNSNIFIVKGDKLVTPPLSEGPLAGCMRALLIEHLEAVERPLEIKDLENADEIILTNCNGVRWISHFGDKSDYINNKTKEIVAFLNTLI